MKFKFAPSLPEQLEPSTFYMIAQGEQLLEIHVTNADASAVRRVPLNAGATTWADITDKPTTFTPSTHAHDAGDITSGIFADARLPARLRKKPETVSDWNSAVNNGWYQGFNATNAPGAGMFIGNVECHHERWVTQTVHEFNSDSEADTKTYRRESSDSAGVAAWGPWYRLRLSETEQKAVTQAWWDNLSVPISKVDSLQGALDGKQAALVSGTNIKTVNGKSLLGSGDLVIAGNSAEYSAAIGDTLISPKKPTTGTWIETGYVYLNSSYPSLQSVIGTVTDGSYSSTGVNIPASSAMAYGNGVFVAAGSNYANVCSTSSDNGVSWLNRSLPVYTNWNNVVFGNNKFVMTSGSGVNYVAQSSDGITWTQASLPETATIHASTYGNGLFVLASNTNAVFTSPDGITWTKRVTPFISSPFSIAFGNGIFILTGLTGMDYLTSSDGINWVKRTHTNTYSFFKLAFGLGKFIGTCFYSNQEINKVYTSVDGVSWTEKTLNANVSSPTIFFGGGMFLIAGYNTTACQISFDGDSWVSKTMSSSATCGAYNKGKFFIGGLGGGSIISITSYDANTQFLVPKVVNQLSYPYLSWIKAL